MDKYQLIIHSIVNNNIGDSFNELIAIKRKHQLDIQKIIESRIHKLVPHDSIDHKSLSVSIRLIALNIIEFFKREGKSAKINNSGKSLSVLIESIIDDVLNEEPSLRLHTCICRIQVDDNISFKDLTDLVVAIERLHEYTGYSMPNIESIQISQRQKINTLGGEVRSG